LGTQTRDGLSRVLQAECEKSVTGTTADGHGREVECPEHRDDRQDCDQEVNSRDMNVWLHLLHPLSTATEIITSLTHPRCSQARVQHRGDARGFWQQDRRRSKRHGTANGTATEERRSGGRTASMGAALQYLPNCLQFKQGRGWQMGRS